MVLADQNWLGNTSNFCGLRLLQLRLTTISSSASPSSEIHGTQDRWWSSIAEGKKKKHKPSAQNEELSNFAQSHLRKVSASPWHQKGKVSHIKTHTGSSQAIQQTPWLLTRSPVWEFPFKCTESNRVNLARITYCYKGQLTQLMRKLRPKLGVSEWYVFTFLFVSGSQFFNDLNTTTNR